MIKEESDCVGKRMMKICQTALCFPLFCPPLAPHERAEKQIECLRRENMQSSLFQPLQKQHRRCNEAERWEGHFSTTVGQTRLTTAQPTSAARHLSKSSRRLWLLWPVFLRSFTDSCFSIATVHRQAGQGQYIRKPDGSLYTTHDSILAGSSWHHSHISNRFSRIFGPCAGFYHDSTKVSGPQWSAAGWKSYWMTKTFR